MYKPLTERNPKSLEREYRCRNCEHEFKTAERVVEQDPDVFIVLPDTGFPVRFDSSILESHLEKHLKKLLTAEQRRGVTVRTAALFPRRLPAFERVKVDSKHAAKVGDDPVLAATSVRTVVLDAFRDEIRRQTSPDLTRRFKAAAAMYRLTQVEITLEGYAKWLREYFSLSLSAPTARAKPRAEVWVPPSSTPRAPRIVVKNRITEDDQIPEGEPPPRRDRAERRSREHATFRREILQASVAAAIGRETHEQPIAPEALTRRVVEWVLWCCDGQPIVRSSQLAAFAAGALRRSAPVAYMRWQALGKELWPEELHDEALELIERPPVPLIFNPPRPPGLQAPRR